MKRNWFWGIICILGAILIFGNLFRDEIRHNKFVYEVFPKKEYINNLLCYQIKPVKISAGSYEEDDTYKFCKEERRYYR